MFLKKSFIHSIACLYF